MKEQWLKTAGFVAGDYVEVECEGDKITLTKTTSPGTKNTKKSLEERVKVLDSNQRKKLADFIEKL